MKFDLNKNEQENHFVEECIKSIKELTQQLQTGNNKPTQLE
jgi:hypothetical protein